MATAGKRAASSGLATVSVAVKLSSSSTIVSLMMVTGAVSCKTLGVNVSV